MANELIGIGVVLLAAGFAVFTGLAIQAVFAAQQAVIEMPFHVLTGFHKATAAKRQQDAIEEADHIPLPSV